MHLAHKVSGKKTYFTVQKFTEQKSVMTKTAILWHLVNFFYVICQILNVISVQQICCKQLHANQSKEVVGVFPAMANTMENLKETNKFSSIFSVLNSNKISSSPWNVK